jgi:hypothetical protein
MGVRIDGDTAVGQVCILLRDYAGLLITVLAFFSTGLSFLNYIDSITGFQSLITASIISALTVAEVGISLEIFIQVEGNAKTETRADAETEPKTSDETVN